MWQILYHLVVGLMFLPYGLILTAGGVGALWYLLTDRRARSQHVLLLLSPLQTAAGLILVYMSYQHLLSIFGMRLPF